MDKIKTIQILEALASGCSPFTGEVLQEDSILNERDVIRALQIAIDNLSRDIVKEITPLKQEKKKSKKDRPWKEVIFFQKEVFNNLTKEQIELLKTKVINLGIQKQENLSEQVIEARIKHSRAYEEWSDDEKELLIEAIQSTNDLALLSECFQRGEDAIKTCGQKIIYQQTLE